VAKCDVVTTQSPKRYLIVEPELELALVSRLRTGDSAALDEIYELFNRRLLSFLTRMAKDRSVAEDLLEETWLRFVSSAENLRVQTRLGPWLFTVARNLFISYCRSRVRESSYTADLVFLWPGEIPKTPFDLASSNEFEKRLEAAIAALPPIYREVILLVGVEQLRAAEAAEICGVSPEALRQRLKRARDLLLGLLESRGSNQERCEEISHVANG